MFGSSPNLGPITVPIPADNMQQTVDSLPQMAPRKRGMFAGMQINPGNAIAGFLAGMYPKYADAFLQPMMQRQQGQLQMRQMILQNQMETQRQQQLAQLTAQLRLLYPDGQFAQSLIQSGVQPGTPDWTKAMQTHVQNEQDPVVMTPQGPMLRSQIVGTPPTAPVGKLTPIDGGQTPPASGNFRY